GPGRVGLVCWGSGGRELPMLFVSTHVLHPRRFASRHAPRVSAVSPLWLRSITSGRSAGAFEYRYSEASSALVGTRATSSRMYFPTNAAWYEVPHATSLIPVYPSRKNEFSSGSATRPRRVSWIAWGSSKIS